MGKRTYKTYAQQKIADNMNEYSYYNRYFKRLLLSLFKWDNLPDGIPQRFIENVLYTDGLIIAFKPKRGLNKGNLVFSRATVQGYNNYDEPTYFHAYSNNNLIDENVSATDCIVIYNNYFKMPSVVDVNYFSQKLTEIETTISVNQLQLRHPYLVSCPEGQIESVKQMFAKVQNGEPYILANESYKANVDISVFDLKATNNIPQLEDTRRKIITEALTYFGINNVNIDKKERLITAEADQNNEQISINKEVMLLPRLEGIKKVNKMFNTNIQISICNSLQDEILLNKGGDI